MKSRKNVKVSFKQRKTQEGHFHLCTFNINSLYFADFSLVQFLREKNIASGAILEDPVIAELQETLSMTAHIQSNTCDRSTSPYNAANSSTGWSDGMYSLNCYRQFDWLNV